MGVKMDGNTEIVTLQEIYQKMDSEGRKKMTTAAAQLLKVQKSFDNKPNAVQSQKRFLRKERQNTGY